MARFGLTAAALAGHLLFGVGNQSHIVDQRRSNMNIRPFSRRRKGISCTSMWIGRHAGSPFL